MRLERGDGRRPAQHADLGEADRARPVDTEIWDHPGSEEPLYQGPKVPAEVVAEGIVEALGSDGFEHYLPDMKAVVDAKNADLDAFIAGAAEMAPR